MRKIIVITLICGLFAVQPVYSSDSYDGTITGRAAIYSKVDHKDDKLIVTIETDSGAQAVNAVGAQVRYQTDSLEFISSDSSGSFCEFLIQDGLKDEGDYQIFCGLPAPGETGTNTVTRLEFKILKPGWTSLDFGEDTMLLANDGLGTDVLQDRINHYVLIE